MGVDLTFLEVAIEQARIGRGEGGVPIGAALVADGVVTHVRTPGPKPS